MSLESHLPKLVSKTDLGCIKTATKMADALHLRLAFVGGVVRDLVLRRKIKDIDFLVDHPAQEFVNKLQSKLGGKLVQHDRFLTFSLHLDSGQKIDVATAREEHYTSPGVLPDVSPSKIENDLKRRDFSINAIAWWLTGPHQHQFLDPFSGQKDIQEKQIRALHDKSFIDDPTRVFRAARFAARFGFFIEKKTEGLIKESLLARLPHDLTPVRRRHEFELILKEDHPLNGLKILEGWGALESLHPNWELQEGHVKALLGGQSGSKQDIFVDRLRRWFKPWGPIETEKMMTDLSFERDIKKKVLSTEKL